MDDLIYAGIDTAEAGLGALVKRFAKHSVVKWLLLFRQNLILLVFSALFGAGTTFFISLRGDEPIKLLPLPQSNTLAITCFAVWVMAMFPWATERVFGTLGRYLFIPAIDRVVDIFKPNFSLLDRIHENEAENEAKESMALLDRMSMTW